MSLLTASITSPPRDRQFLQNSMQGQIQDFLREGASQPEMTDVQSQKSAEELPNMHASVFATYNYSH